MYVCVWMYMYIYIYASFHVQGTILDIENTMMEKTYTIHALKEFWFRGDNFYQNKQTKQTLIQNLTWPRCCSVSGSYSRACVCVCD